MDCFDLRILVLNKFSNFLSRAIEWRDRLPLFWTEKDSGRRLEVQRHLMLS